mmetsp:Transcript_73301/g.203323  ORF Transcript_73301/g.203323 Transcript_73301/m.203323 type:complete len:363 (-) Transcript_73301:60-1148(-)
MAFVGPVVRIEEHEVVDAFLQFGLDPESDVGKLQLKYRCIDRAYPESAARVLQLLAFHEEEVLDFATLEPIACLVPRGTLLDLLGEYSSFIVYELEEVGLLTRSACDDKFTLRIAAVDPRRVVATGWAVVYGRLAAFAFDFVHTQLYLFVNPSVSQDVHVYRKDSLDQYIWEHMSRTSSEGMSVADFDGTVLPLDVYTQTPMPIALQVQLLAGHLTYMDSLASVQGNVFNLFYNCHRTDPNGPFMKSLHRRPIVEMFSWASRASDALSKGLFDQYVSQLTDFYLNQNPLNAILFNKHLLHLMRMSLLTLPESIDQVELERQLDSTAAHNAALTELWSPDSISSLCRSALTKMLHDVVANLNV